MEDTDKFLARVRRELNRSEFKNNNSYIDLAIVESVPPAEVLFSSEPPPDRLAGFQEIIIEEIAKCNLDKIKIGINELMKHLLVQISKDNEEIMAECYMYRLRMLFNRCLMPDFPFQEEIWNYICDCLKTVGSFLVEQGYYEACREIIDTTAGMGRIAALKGLPTGTTQSSLRILENKAMEHGEKQLASVSRNARFNLET